MSLPSIKNKEISPPSEPRSRKGEKHTLYSDDLTNRKFGKLLVIEKLPPSGRWNTSFAWKCKCDCGKEARVTSAALIRKRSTSCGCVIPKPPINLKYKESGEAAFRELHGSYIRNAKLRGFIFELSLEEFRILTKSNCNYCDNPPLQVMKRRYQTGDYYYNGIDREDNTKGYTKENCVPCCGVCNRMKMGSSVEDFKEKITQIYLNLYKNEV